MGKSGGSSSWLSAVKKAFRSPSKDASSDKRSYRSEDLEQQEQEKRRGKRRWIFGKHLNSKEQTIVAKSSIVVVGETADANYSVAEAEKRHTIAVAMAAEAAAEAAIATAQAAVEFIKQSRPCTLVAATTIQKTFRGYLARRALSALKGLVKLQALVRGHNVRKRTAMTLQRMQALVRVQARVCDQRRRLSVSNDDISFTSTSFTDIKPTSRDGDWDENRSVAKEVDSISMLRRRDETDLAYAFSNKIWRSHMEEYSESEAQSEEIDCTHKWRETTQREKQGRYSCDTKTPIKIVHVDDMNSYQQTKYSLYSNRSPLQNQIPSFQSPIKNCQTELKHLRVRSASPRCLREVEPVYPKSQTPSLGCLRRSNAAVPSYMAETASTKNRVRSQSAPRQPRPSTPERDGVAVPKRRLFFGGSDEAPSPSCRNTPRVQR